MRTARKVEEAAAAVRRRGGCSPERAVLLETHMGGFAGELHRLATVPFRKVPHLPDPQPPAQGGTLLLGGLAGVPTAVMEGRVRLCEGWLPGETAFPVRVLAALGARRLVFVAEGRPLREGLEPGLLLLADRIDLTAASPLVAPVGEAGPQLEPAPPPARAGEAAREAAAASGVRCAPGVAALIRGPFWPGRAEEGMLRGFGADAVTHALAPELAVASYLGIESVAFLLLGGGWGAEHRAFLAAFLGRF